MAQPTIKYLLNTPVNELLQSCLAIEPELRETAPLVTQKLFEWMRNNNLSAQAVTVAVIHLLATGTEEGRNISQV